MTAASARRGWRRWGAAIEAAVFWQHRHPVGYWQHVERVGLRRSLGPARLAALLLWPILLALALAFRAEGWARAIALGALAPLSLLAAVGLAVTLTGAARFWLLYALSPPVALLGLVCALAESSPTWLTVGWAVAFPWLLGALFVDAGALWIAQHARDQHQAAAGQRPGGPAADLPALAYWRHLRLGRFLAGGALVLAGVILLAVSVDHPTEFYLGLSALSAAAGCLRLEAIALAYIWRAPLVYFDPQAGVWQTTYAGRLALVAPAYTLQTILLEQSPAVGAAATLALLREGGLGVWVRRSYARWPASNLGLWLLALSLQAGGGQALHYLQPGLPGSLQSLAQAYAALAHEAAKPSDLQRWIALLPTAPPAGVEPGLEQRVWRALVATRTALLAYEYQPALDSALTVLAEISPSAPAADQSWPVALGRHLHHHLRHLLFEAHGRL